MRWSRIQTNLIFVKFAVFKLSLSLFAEGDDDKTHKDVHHEEGYDDDVDDEENGNLYAVVIDGSSVLCISINGFVQEPVKYKIK